MCILQLHISLFYVFQGGSSKTCHIVQKIFVLTGAIMYQTYVFSLVTYIIVLYVFQGGSSKVRHIVQKTFFASTKAIR